MDDEHRARRQMELRPYIIHARPAQAAMQCAAAFTVALAASAAISGSNLAEYAAVPEALEAEQEQSSCSQVGSPLASFDESAILLISFPNLENDELDAAVDELYYGALLSRGLANSSENSRLIPHGLYRAGFCMNVLGLSMILFIAARLRPTRIQNEITNH